MRPLHLTFILGLLVSTPAHALLTGCNVSATAVAFGTYDPSSNTPKDGVGTVTVSCGVLIVGLLQAWNISLSAGNGSYTQRHLSSGANQLFYNLYSNASRTTIWGDGSGSTSLVSDSRLLIIGSNNFLYTVYGRIPVHQDKPSATYTDLITVTLNY